MMWISLAMVLGGLVSAFALLVAAMRNIEFTYGSHFFYGSLGVSALGAVVALVGFAEWVLL